MTNLDTLSKEEFKTLLEKYNDEYYYSTPTITDDEYDKIRDIYEQRFGTWENIGASTENYDKRVKLPYWMGSMDKMKNEDEGKFKRWKTKFTTPWIVMSKLDGISALLHRKGKSVRMYTRGDGEYGFDITHLIRYMNLPSLPQKDFTLRGELIMKKSKYIEKYKDTYATARHLVNGVVNAKSSPKTIIRDIHFVVYEVMYPREFSFSEQMNFIKSNGFRCVDSVIPKKLSLPSLDLSLVVFK